MAAPAPAPAHRPYRYEPHPHIAARLRHGPATAARLRRPGGALGDAELEAPRRLGLNTRLAVAITGSVGTMWCFYAFVLLSLVSGPAAISSGNVLVIVSWLTQTCFQLWLLPVIIVGQDVHGKVADARARQTWHDAGAGLHETQSVQQHLFSQDEHLGLQDGALGALAAELVALQEAHALLASAVGAPQKSPPPRTGETVP